MYCKRCKHFKLYDNIFGYCRKYNEQALTSEKCKQIIERIK